MSPYELRAFFAEVDARIAELQRRSAKLRAKLAERRSTRTLQAVLAAEDAIVRLMREVEGIYAHESGTFPE